MEDWEQALIIIASLVILSLVIYLLKRRCSGQNATSSRSSGSSSGQFTQSFLQKTTQEEVNKYILSQYKENFGSQNTLNLNNEGLPNIGNTCFMNSVLQCLYSSSRFKNLIISKANRNESWKLFNLLKNIFNMIDKPNKNNQRQKQIALKELILLIQKKHQHIIYKQQHDFLDFLTLLLDELENQNSTIKEEFMIKYSKKCKCQRQFQSETVYFILEEKCGICGQRYKHNIVNTNTLLLFVENKNEDYNEYVKFKYSNASNYYYYENTSFVCYTGNKKSGHYFVNRKKDNKWLKISDSSVNYIQKADLPKKMPRVCLYQFRGQQRK